LKKKKQKVEEPFLNCIVYLSTEGDLYHADEREKKQLRYIKEYAKAHNIKITKMMHRDVMGQADVNRHFRQMVSLVEKKIVDGIILANMMCISVDMADAYYKVGMVKAVGGQIVTVDEGRLGMRIKEAE